MFVRLKISRAASGGGLSPGDLIDVSEHEAQQMIDEGQAVAVEPLRMTVRAQNFAIEPAGSPRRRRRVLYMG